MTRRVSFVGPLPPPVNGFSSVCAMMLDRLRTRMPVEVFNRAPKLRARALGLVQQLAYPARYLGLCLARRDLILYLALSGGRGQLVDLTYVLISKLFRRSVFVHHHSFIYINSPSWLNRCFFALVRNEAHVVLSANMGESLTQIYGLNPGAVRVVSNAAFYDSDEEARAPANDSAPLQLGFLSNITFEKGIVEFFDILQKLNERGIAYRAHIAGPLAAEARHTFDKLLAAAKDVEYVGPLYGEQKERFYRQLDVFIFPTNYVNEAEPSSMERCVRASTSSHAIEGRLPRCSAMGPVSPLPGSTLWKQPPRTLLNSTMIGMHCWLRNACQCSRPSGFDPPAKLHWRIYWLACKARMNR
jgi:glycosyltransferase involved in cell wall biosynthesis